MSLETSKNVKVLSGALHLCNRHLKYLKHSSQPNPYANTTFKSEFCPLNLYDNGRKPSTLDNKDEEKLK